MIRVRRHPLAGLTLLAILTPLLAAGPGMPCAGDDTEHHGDVGHVMQADHAGHAGHGAHAERSGHAATQLPALAQAPDAGHDAPAPVDCAMGMLCSGTVVAPLAVSVASVPVSAASLDTDDAWTLHTSDPSLPDRPPTA